MDSDRIAYVVIPIVGPNRLGGEFRTLTQVKAGDFGVVVSEDRVIPVIVADGGPFPKLGEGSIALHRALGHEVCQTKDEQGRCATLIRPLSSHPGPVVTILFPGSRRSDLTQANVADLVQQEGLQLWSKMRGQVGR